MYLCTSRTTFIQSSQSQILCVCMYQILQKVVRQSKSNSKFGRDNCVYLSILASAYPDIILL